MLHTHAKKYRSFYFTTLLSLLLNFGCSAGVFNQNSDYGQEQEVFSNGYGLALNVEPYLCRRGNTQIATGNSMETCVGRGYLVETVSGARIPLDKADAVNPSRYGESTRDVYGENKRVTYFYSDNPNFMAWIKFYPGYQNGGATQDIGYTLDRGRTISYLDAEQIPFQPSVIIYSDDILIVGSSLISCFHSGPVQYSGPFYVSQKGTDGKLRDFEEYNLVFRANKYDRVVGEPLTNNEEIPVGKSVIFYRYNYASKTYAALRTIIQDPGKFKIYKNIPIH